ncbi:MAG: transglutaminase [Rhodobacteraceae bacterium]|nr:transglutaminase [Paracoccaceae bacterium]
MPVLTVTHVTTYRYRSAVRLGPHRLMLRPRESRALTLNRFDLFVMPPARVYWFRDASANDIATATFDAPTDTLSIRSRAIVTLPDNPWNDAAIAGFATTYPFSYTPDELACLGLLTVPQYADRAGRLAVWVKGFIARHPTGTLALLSDINTGISQRIAYQSRAAEGTQGPLETLDRGWGSCRDFAVLFAEAVRTLGLGARIVSGYLHDPGGAGPDAVALDTTHAWVDVFLPGAGWIAFDPTNRKVAPNTLVPVAVARGIRQVAPVTGSFSSLTAAAHTMDVAVSVRETLATGAAI